MPILTISDYLGSTKQVITWNKTASRTAVAANPFSVLDLAGNPGAGTLSAGNTANGVVRTDATAGFPAINTITGEGALTKVNFASPVATRLAVYDQLFSCGAYAFNANTTLTSQPSFSGRVPNANYRGLELWIEAVTAFTGNLSVQINYLDQDGNAGDTGVVATGAALIVGRMMRIPLASGDSGVSQITQVRGTVATVGTFNVHVMRKLWEGRVPVANSGDVHPIHKTGRPVVYDTSAFFVVVTPDSTATSLPTVDMEISQA